VFFVKTNSKEIFMAKYVDVYLLPISEKKLPAYREMATAAGKLFRKHGALTYREYVASDLKAIDAFTAFPTVIELKEGETLVYAAVEFESESHRNESLERISQDPEMKEIMPKEPIFDMKRMVYGGFAILVDA
jgi:uncharacterized protein YbaA (DUF1428 family)